MARYGKHFDNGSWVHGSASEVLGATIADAGRQLVSAGLEARRQRAADAVVLREFDRLLSDQEVGVFVGSGMAAWQTAYQTSWIDSEELELARSVIIEAMKDAQDQPFNKTNAAINALTLATFADGTAVPLGFAIARAVVVCLESMLDELADTEDEQAGSGYEDAITHLMSETMNTARFTAIVVDVAARLQSGHFPASQQFHHDLLAEDGGNFVPQVDGSALGAVLIAMSETLTWIANEAQHILLDRSTFADAWYTVGGWRQRVDGLCSAAAELVSPVPPPPGTELAGVGAISATQPPPPGEYR